MGGKRPDPFTPAERSRVMSRIRSNGNRSTELKLLKLLRGSGITGWRRNSKLFGRPDFVFPKERVAIFVDGCFWHGCKRCYRRPGTSQTYWDAKVERNRARDLAVVKALRGKEWKVLRVWEHELKKPIVVLRKLKRRLLR
ncbi:MAG TPA: very short patch repair endonuclease [Methylomirabilota bacterium]|nr:very short patch repair endonuclease [Methylomirabilota bacterium]